MHVSLRERNIDIGGAQVFHHLLVQSEAERTQISFVRPRPKRDFDGTVGQVGNICYCLFALGLYAQRMLGGGFQNGGFGGLQIAGVIHAHLHAAQRHGRTVDDTVAHNDAVGQDDFFVIRRTQRGLHHFNFANKAFEAVDFDVVADFKRTEQNNQRAGGKVRQLVFQRQSHRQARATD